MIKSLYTTFQHWSEKGSVFIISDTHFDDCDRDYMGYTITSQDQADIITNTIHKFDTLIHLGDVGNPEYLKDIKGYKVLILGNHDFSATKFKPYFDEIYEGPLIVGKKLILSHEPLDTAWAFNIHGHDHNPANSGDDFHLNLAANVCGYQPQNLGKLIKGGLLKNILDIHRITIDNAAERKGLKMNL